MTHTEHDANTKTGYPATVDASALPPVCRVGHVCAALSISRQTLHALRRHEEIYRPDRSAEGSSPPLWSCRRVRLMAMTHLRLVSSDEAMAIYRSGVKAELTELSQAG